ncbi:hypothetical protein HanRHA438_Chr01g0034831 [Helianthus annuus]|nr:hypothetical protein HanRHA438_Chr01g0034831 [Helianthus annuus]
MSFKIKLHFKSSGIIIFKNMVRYAYALVTATLVRQQLRIAISCPGSSTCSTNYKD